jgi:hypothetical protein
LTVPDQRSKRSRHRRLRVAARHDNDDIGGVDGRSEISGCTLDGSKPRLIAVDIKPAALSNFQEP